MKPRQRLVRGSFVVSPEGIQQADVLIQGEWILAVGPDLPYGGAEVIEAHGLHLFPGGVDAHVHLRDPGATHKEDFTSGTRAALAGGFTTVLDMPNNPEPTTTASAFRTKAELASTRACCDFGLFVGATEDNAVEAAGIPEAVGLKLYMGSSTGDLLVADLETQYCHFATYPRHKPLAVHAEDELAVHLFSQAERRPPICAELATARAIALARFAQRRLHLCHVSTSAEFEAALLARRQGLRLTFEVAPHHLFLTADDENQLGPLAIMNPPLRQQAHQEVLWQGLPQADMVASDHAPHTLAEKAAMPPPAGVPGLETTLPLLLEAAAEGRLTLPQVARLVAAGPAAAFALPHKGRIAPGYHADLTLVDLSATTVLGQRLHTKCQWTPFAGKQVRGRIERVFLRGQDAVMASRVLAEAGWGRLIKPTERQR